MLLVDQLHHQQHVLGLLLVLVEKVLQVPVPSRVGIPLLVAKVVHKNDQH